MAVRGNETDDDLTHKELNKLEQLVQEHPDVAKSLAEKGNSVVEAYLNRVLSDVQ